MADILATPQQAASRQAGKDDQLRVLVAISIAHWVSHFHIFVLPMLFPFLKQQLGVGYIELGFALTVFAVTSGLTQAPIGYLADHLGARKILLIGLCLGGCSLIALGLHLSYPWLIVSAALLGLANSVYHPANYAILSAHMNDARMGRAFSIHAFAGFFGSAVAPAIMAALVATFGGHGALIAAGAVGPLVALLMIAVRIPDASAANHTASAADTRKPNVITPALFVLTIFFFLLSVSSAGIGNFGVVALMSGYGTTFPVANLALTVFLGASAAGVLAGGFLADLTERHGQVAAVCFAVNAVILLVVAAVNLPQAALIGAMGLAGLLSGLIVPSRDMMVRNAAPAGTAGRAFGIVSTGFNIGGIVSPLLFGWIMDRNLPHWVFGVSVMFMVMTVILALVTERNPRATRSA
ncbi:MAG TPA: MFS transporter [Bradyrhizobium sp.]|uniref:MFS transporter n=1 Tax=Bradyrhizobium sp. TaxID=376 RepID=UPI002D7FC0C6|nr:MFS transporter [Bradyrhizobium sp.]HET7887057.1 MFS transporter [Bradyrhizobium sp.]